MDPLSRFFDGPRARNAFLLQVVMAPPWSITVTDEAPLTAVAMARGSAWFLPVGGPPERLGAGDVLLVSGPAPYGLASAPDEPPDIVIGAGQHCSGADGRDLTSDLSTGVGSWGNDPAGPDAMLVGTFRSGGEVGKILMDALPSSVVVHAPVDPILEIIIRELSSDALAQSSALDRLLDLLLIATIREWSAAEAGPVEPTWLSAQRDPLVHRAVQLLHETPERPWTVASLAASVGVSRAVLARRFHERVGAPPMTYLTQWRLAVAADLLADEDRTLSAISRQVGYSSPFSFSAAFKKRYDMSPHQYRHR